jgi:hypothetical protein
MSDITLWIHFVRPRSHWYELPDEQRHELEDRWARVADQSGQQGARRIGRYRCRGQSDFEHVEVWQFPTASAVIDHWDRMAQARYSDYMVTQNVVGSPEVPADSVG